jgi:micrococcal nuclease
MKGFPRLIKVLPILAVVAIALSVGASQWSKSKPSAIASSPQLMEGNHNTEWGTVEAVSDGDTLKVILAGKTVKVRLCGIDAPEKSQPLGTEAKAYLEKLVQNAGGKVGIVATDTDVYGRTVAEVVFVLGKTEQSAQEELLKAGMAYTYPKYVNSCPNAQPFKLAEAIAQSSKAGVWARNDQRPWDYRQSRR